MQLATVFSWFWRDRLNWELSDSEIALFFAILAEINRTRGKNNNLLESRISIGTPKLELLAGISRAEIYRARNRLKQYGLINFISGKGKKNYATYFLGNEFKKVSHIETVTETVSGTVSETLSETLSETRYKNIDIDKDIDIIKKEKKFKKEKKKFLEFVFLKEEEYEKLVERFGKTIIDEYIEKLNNYIGSKGKKYKSHYHTILNWLKKDNIDELPKLVNETSLLNENDGVENYEITKPELRKFI
ncbi:hypothetical protein SAMN02745164_00493 [Marinitoga hydrogenitolerans DSM 16785]|uniref:Uncharacterized protein n=1 Tax=Marinitoga hydrogenitolerans (strain DSM 16785 / JCM 12826 / AT1271) TaxID=1122195 RepID=A0A1M4TSG2_MARH1|nr:hypothetical protein [Marinitoga hydrogenitolerans]SHE47346.1 hypothetical protein SAMN02745164_00493 [Marinitoga hydrogenitolerans DSM 16785]